MPAGGLELKPDGARRRIWNWNKAGHSAAAVRHDAFPKVYPLVLGVNYNCGIRIFSQHRMSLTFSAESCSCRFHVSGACAKVYIINNNNNNNNRFV